MRRLKGFFFSFFSFFLVLVHFHTKHQCTWMHAYTAYTQGWNSVFALIARYEEWSIYAYLYYMYINMYTIYEWIRIIMVHFICVCKQNNKYKINIRSILLIHSTIKWNTEESKRLKLECSISIFCICFRFRIILVHIWLFSRAMLLYIIISKELNHNHSHPFILGIHWVIQ